MPRLVVPFSPATPSPGTGNFAVKKKGEPLQGDDYQDRLVKYIPAESVALYAFADKLVTAFYGINDAGAATKIPADTLFHILPWALFVLGLVGTPIYLYRQKLPKQPWRTHVVISVFAFALWAYTLGGSLFVIHHWYHVLLAGLAAPVFTFVAGWFDPR